MAAPVVRLPSATFPSIDHHQGRNDDAHDDAAGDQDYAQYTSHVLSFLCRCDQRNPVYPFKKN
jgi:hypothetical protein